MVCERGRFFFQNGFVFMKQETLQVFEIVFGYKINSLHDGTNPERVLKRGQWYRTLLRPHFVPSLTIPSPILSPLFSSTAL